MILFLHGIFQKFFSIRPKEFIQVQLFFCYYTIIGIFYTLSVTVGGSLFIANIPDQKIDAVLAWVYVGIVLASVIVVWLYGILSTRVPRITLFSGTHFFMMLTLFLFRLLLGSGHPLFGKWFYFAMVVWLEMCGLLSITLFFSFTGDYFSSRDAKRLYGYIAGGLAMGTIIGGAVTGPCVTVMGVENILWVCIFLLGVGIAFSLFIHRRFAPLCHDNKKSFEEKNAKKLDGVIVSQSFIRYIFISVLLGMICCVLVDFQMKVTAKSIYQNGDDLAVFFGNFYTGIGMVQIPFQFIVVGFLLKRLGIITCLMILPGIHMLMAFLFFTTGHGAFANQAFSIIVSANFLRMVMAETLEIPSRELLFLPLPSNIRLRAQTLMGGVVAPVGQGLAGLLIILFASMGLLKHQYSLFVFGFAACWILVLGRLGPKYRSVLASSLKKHRILQTHESTARAVLQSLAGRLRNRTVPEHGYAF